MADLDRKKSILLAALVAVAVAILWCVPKLQVERARADLYKPDAHRLAGLEDAYRRTLAQILGGLALLYGLYLTQRRIVAAEKNVSVAQEGQVTERFTRAITQLGDDKMAVRLGGIYALERLAKDSEKDYGPIMEVLTAYVREGEATGMLATDSQAVLTVIGRREITGNNRENDRLDLTHAQLVRANLDGASLIEANLFRATLRGAALTEANLRGAALSEAALSEATLIGADLNGANLSGTILSGADLVAANLIGANLNGAILGEADLSGANLGEADLSGANLGEVNLSGADLSRATLIEATLIGADLSGANLSGANLSRANLSGADLSEAENLTAEQVQTADNWRETLLPTSLQYLLD